MKKIILPILMAILLISCKKEDTHKSPNLDTLIKNNDVKGLQAYKEQQKKKMDSLSQIMTKVDTQLTHLGVDNAAQGVVSIQKLAPSVFTHNIEIQGNVTTDQDVKVQPQLPGTLSLFVKEGQHVSRGQLIGRVSDGGINDQYQQAQISVSAIKAQLQQAKYSAELAKITFEKQSKLWEQKIGSEIQFLQARTNYQAAQKQILAIQNQVSAAQKAADAVKANLAKTAIIAPFSGVIDEVITQNGQIVSPGTNIVKLISLGTMKVQANVPETYLSKVRPGSVVSIFIPTLNKTFNSSVRLVGNYINPLNRTFRIEVAIPNEGGFVKPNLLAQVKIQDYVNPNAIQIPAQYIYEDAEHLNYVFIATNIKAQDAVAKKVMISTGQKSENSVEITTGLKADDVIILDGSKNLSDGQKVKISN